MPGPVYIHYRDYAGQWPWPHFTPAEVACKHCGELYLDPASMDALERLRSARGAAIIINSAHRCVFHNHAVGGTKHSQHLTIAFDCRCPVDSQAVFAAAAKKAGFTGIGRYPGKGFVHVDCGPRREWTG